jgi:cutinase
MPPEVADHVAAVAVFGNPSDRHVGAPLTGISPLYGPKVIDLFMPADPICAAGGDMSVPRRDEMFSAAHLQYVQSGMASQAAAFAASRLYQV